MELELPISFPLKDEFEKLNGTRGGMNIIADRDGRPDVDDMIDDERDVDEEDYSPEPLWDENQDDDDDGGPPPPAGKSLDKKSESADVHHPIHHTYGSAGDGIICHDDEGQWVKLDKLGRPYPVDGRDGRRIVKTTRTKEFTPEEWKSLGHEHRKALAEEIKTAGIEAPHVGDDPEGEDPERKKKSKKKKKGKDAGKDDVSRDDDKIEKPDEPPDEVAVSRPLTSEQRIVDAVSSGCSEGLEHDPNHTIDENNNSVEWEELVSHVNRASASVSISQNISISCDGKDRHDQSIPSMACIHHVKDDHRKRLGETFVGSVFHNALVSRPVGRKEMLSDPEALESMMKERKGQWSADVYDFKNVREYDDVVREASKQGEEIHMARVHGICVEEHSELPKEDKPRKFKGRGVLLGNQVKNQNFEAALFQDLGNSPASFEPSRWADMFGCLPGHKVQLADAIQAYIQASLTGVACWVELPDEAWPPWINRKKLDDQS